jgi:hypothetical protein
MFWLVQRFLSIYVGPGCSLSNYISSWYSSHFLHHSVTCFWALLIILLPWVSIHTLSFYQSFVWHSIYMPKPTKPLWFNIIYYSFSINLFNSSFVLILHVPSLSLVGPKILLNIFLSNTNSFCFMVSFRTHVSQAYVTIGQLCILRSNI